MSRELSLNQPLGRNGDFTLEDVLSVYETGYEVMENEELVLQVLKELDSADLEFLKGLAQCMDRPGSLTEDYSVCEIRQGLLMIAHRIGEIAGSTNCAMVLKEILRLLHSCK